MREPGHLSVGFTLMAAAGVVACAAPQSVGQRTCPVPDWRGQFTPDSVLDFCAPPDFIQVKQGQMWTRAAAGAQPQSVGEEWLKIHALTAGEAFEIQPWPPSLLRDTSYRPCIHCLDVSAYAVHWDSVGGRLVRVETGRVTGGFVGVRDKPMLQAGWLVDSTRWVFVQGQARTDSGLNELRAVLRTIRIRP